MNFLIFQNLKSIKVAFFVDKPTRLKDHQLCCFWRLSHKIPNFLWSKRLFHLLSHSSTFHEIIVHLNSNKFPVHAFDCFQNFLCKFPSNLYKFLLHFSDLHAIGLHRRIHQSISTHHLLAFFHFKFFQYKATYSHPPHSQSSLCLGCMERWLPQQCHILLDSIGGM